MQNSGTKHGQAGGSHEGASRSSAGTEEIGKRSYAGRIVGIVLCALVFLAILWPVASSLLGSSHRPATVAGSPQGTQGELITKSDLYVLSMAADHEGNIWIGTDGQGIWEQDAATGNLRQFTVKDGLGDDYGYAVAVDGKDRVWVGHLRTGVSVFNGEKWQNYEPVTGTKRPDSLSGPLGERVFRIAVCPTDGDVWIATNAGLTRYSEGSGNTQDSALRTAHSSSGSWTYYTRADGLPSDEASSLAFDQVGNIYVGTQCDGIAMADASDDYHAWRVVRGPDQMPTIADGAGLPTNLINDLMVEKDGTVYAGTSLGLAWSKDHGHTWRYIRGRDYGKKVRGRYGGAPHGWKENSDSPLAEDMVTCLAEGPGGKVWVGHWSAGYELIDCSSGQHWDGMLNSSDGYATSILPVAGSPQPAVGWFGSALLVHGSKGGSAPIAPLPAGAQPPDSAQLDAMIRHIESIAPERDSTEPLAVPVEDDWSTTGAWLGRYGRYFACLCAMAQPHDYLWGAGPEPVTRHAYIGPNCLPGDSIRYWRQWLYTNRPTVLEIPQVYLESRVASGAGPSVLKKDRRGASWDDHGEHYPIYRDGPDIWCTLHIPKGLFYLSLYAMNKDGHDVDSPFNKLNRLRDYEISIWPGNVTSSERAAIVMRQTPLAQERLRQFWGGVYKRFLVRGPGYYTFRQARDYSRNAILSGVFLDSVDEFPAPYFKTAEQWRQEQEARERAAKQNWPAKAKLPASDYGMSDLDRTVDQLLGDLDQLQIRNPRQWAIEAPRMYVLLSRIYPGHPAGLSDPTQLRRWQSRMATLCYQTLRFGQWEGYLRAEGKTPARDIEKALQWDGHSDYAGKGYQTVTEYLRRKAAHVSASRPTTQLRDKGGASR